MTHQAPVPIDPAQAAEAQRLWREFTQGVKYSVIAIVFILLALAAAFTDLL